MENVFEELQHWLAAVKKTENEEEAVRIYHLCGYEEKPTQEDKDELKTELREDKEFGLTDIVDDLEIIYVPQDIIKSYFD